MEEHYLDLTLAELTRNNGIQVCSPLRLRGCRQRLRCKLIMKIKLVLKFNKYVSCISPVLQPPL